MKQRAARVISCLQLERTVFSHFLPVPASVSLTGALLIDKCLTLSATRPVRVSPAAHAAAPLRSPGARGLDGGHSSMGCPTAEGPKGMREDSHSQSPRSALPWLLIVSLLDFFLFMFFLGLVPGGRKTSVSQGD